ncbi:MAG TPA: hypothetical protein VFR41_00780 [Acidimicrobiia bacterium]|nr:hypothetical protein [Acidimicrobiia bacterium]
MPASVHRSFEELFFRGVVQSILGRSVGAGMAAHASYNFVIVLATLTLLNS